MGQGGGLPSVGQGSGVGSTDDRDLVLRFQNGDERAYAEMYRRHAARVRHVCARYLQNGDDVDEAVQETFLKAYQALPKFNGRYLLGAWLSRIATNVALDQVRAKARGGNAVTLPPEEEVLGTERGEDVRVGTHLRLNEAFEQMQPLHARALLLRAHEGLSHVELADLLAMTPQQVKALLHRARRSFRKAWDTAEGWAVAPLIGLRSRLQARGDGVKDSGAHAAPNLAAASPSLTPLVERVATTAMAVAVAFVGMPSEPKSAEPSAREQVRRAPFEQRVTKTRARSQTKAKTEVASAPESRAPARAKKASSQPVLDLALPKTPKPTRTQPPSPPGDGDDGEISPPSTSETREVQRKLHKSLNDLLE